ncbi:iron-containing redox enzyme family protein [Terricaulis sp.]|uniref:TenA family transcriptional regulator n=1 Tax=Terricaulis sp. TaxID=2768686 RepID=UPI002AC5A1BB|nr:iron-containing redox enzyme family protein [Terricaulis sp.]MDZ4691811.1 iron-containing redox enzyme family protein [Terricaulis sp.]
MSFFQQLKLESAPEAQTLLTIPQLVDGLAGRISRETYVGYLSQAYHHVKHTTSLMKAAKSRLDDSHETFRKALDEYAAEEEGHEEWILNDIRACGGDAEAVRTSTPLLATEMMVAFAYDYINRINPMGFFGMVFVLEGTSVMLASRGASAVQQSLGLPPSAFSYLTSHGALDQDHMVFFAKLMDQVTSPDDQAAIVHVAKRMFILFGNVFRAIPHTQEAAHAA